MSQKINRQLEENNRVFVPRRCEAINLNLMSLSSAQALTILTNQPESVDGPPQLFCDSLEHFVMAECDIVPLCRCVFRVHCYINLSRVSLENEAKKLDGSSLYPRSLVSNDLEIFVYLLTFRQAKSASKSNSEFVIKDSISLQFRCRRTD